MTKKAEIMCCCLGAREKTRLQNKRGRGGKEVALLLRVERISNSKTGGNSGGSEVGNIPLCKAAKKYFE